MLKTNLLQRSNLVSQCFWLCPILCLVMSVSFSVNIPFLDDYNLVLDFLNRFEDATSLSEKLRILGTPVHNHLIVTYYLLILADHAIFHAIDFRHLIVGINLGYFAIIYVLYRIFNCIEIPSLYFIPVLLLLSVPVYNLINWSSSFMHVFAVLFILLTIWEFTKNDRYYFTRACGYATMAALSSGGGMLAFLCAIPFLWHKRNIKYTVIWSVCFLILLSIYLYNFSSMGHTTGISLGKMAIYIVNFVVFFGTIFRALYSDHHLWGNHLRVFLFDFIQLDYCRSLENTETKSCTTERTDACPIVRDFDNFDPITVGYWSHHGLPISPISYLTTDFYILVFFKGETPYNLSILYCYIDFFSGLLWI